MEISLLRSFIVAAQSDNFDTAADMLYISQSALTKQLHRLEKAFGVPLFNRSGRRAVLTSAGEELLQLAPAFLQQYDNLLIAVGNLAHVLHIAVFPVASAYEITPTVTQFAQCNPNVSVVTQECENGIIPQLLDRGTCEIGIFRCELNKISNWHCVPLCRDSLCLVVPATHPLAHYDVVDLAWFSKENFLLLNPGTQLYQASLDACSNAGFSPRVFHTGFSAASILDLVRKNSGVSIMMRQVALATKDDSLRVLAFQDAPESEVVIATKKKYPLSPAVKCFFEFVQKRHAEHTSPLL